MGTLSKAVGALGGYIAGNRTLIELLINRARGFIFTTGLPPATLAAANAALTVIRSSPGTTTKPVLARENVSKQH